MRPQFEWQIGERGLPLGGRTRVMGVLNVTPDSFSDGGQFLDPQKAIEQGLRLLDDGADIVDIGGESTRPASGAVTSAADESARILPVIAGLRRQRPDCCLSVDTYKAEVARKALAAGADIVNDVSGLTWDPAMAESLAASRCGVVLMHTRGRPEQWSRLSPMNDPVAQVKLDLSNTAQRALAAGAARDRLVLDPGFGFGKNYQENLALLRDFSIFSELGFPLLAGASRKTFLGRAMAALRGGEPPAPADRVSASVAAAVLCALRGAHIVRVHDVRETVEVLAVADAVLEQQAASGK